MHYASVDLYNAPGGASETAALKASKKGHMVETVAVSAQFRDAHVLRRVQAFWAPFFTARGFNADPSSTHHTFHSLLGVMFNFIDQGAYKEGAELEAHLDLASEVLKHTCGADPRNCGGVNRCRQTARRRATSLLEISLPPKGGSPCHSYASDASLRDATDANSAAHSPGN